jgi:hypothetical protein
MNTKVDSILATLGVEIPANINNITNITDITDVLTTSKFADSNPNEQILAPLSLGLASLSSSPCSDAMAFVKRSSIKKLPAAWRGVKLDLFQNGQNKDSTLSLKLNISVLEKNAGKQIQLMAALNSKFDSSVQRGVEPDDWKNNPHWICVRQLRKELTSLYNDVRISKVGLKNKGGGTEMVVFVYKDRTDAWCVDYVREAQVYQFDLIDPLTDAQKASKIIASGFHGNKTRKLITAKELGI